MSEGGKTFYFYKQEDQIDLFFALIEKIKEKFPKYNNGSREEFAIDFRSVKSLEQLLHSFKHVSHHKIITKEINNAVSKFNEKKDNSKKKLELVKSTLFWRFQDSVKLGIEFQWNEPDHKAIKQFLGEHEIFNRARTEPTLFKQSAKADLFIGKKFWVYIEETDEKKALVGASKARIDFKNPIKAELTVIDPDKKKQAKYEGTFKFSNNEKYLLVELGENNHQFVFDINNNETITNLCGKYTNLTKTLIPVQTVLSEIKGKAFVPKFYGEQEMQKIPKHILSYFSKSVSSIFYDEKPNDDNSGKEEESLSSLSVSPIFYDEKLNDGNSGKEEESLSSLSVPPIFYDEKLSDDNSGKEESLSSLIQNGTSLTLLIKIGVRVKALIEEGISLSTLLKADISVNTLIDEGVCIKSLLEAGVSLSDLLKAGVSIKTLLDGGVHVKSLLEEGVSVKALYIARVSVYDLEEAGVSQHDLIEAGVRVRDRIAAMHKRITGRELNEKTKRSEKKWVVFF